MMRGIVVLPPSSGVFKIRRNEMKADHQKAVRLGGKI